ncbi:nucleotidyltransferase domain-containing protein [Streptomyces litchfieldiae]|uniref:Nucleotidyltransferase domain-containing protein n=1 Tax=Streptomyces litchfieldiae TaxID=3075543 RepID=A0ABU2MTR2_9ACTN|nr:nucleotidyltransferase domain-containing protein [Streptomyces sp. DSM 44938]MDT0345033.1 nucleotidyltransferase domain-containing protein [Streptomyces sp. DSM 44938]
MWGHLVERHTILSVVVGSRAFGLAVAGSDTDRRGVYVAPTEDFWSLTKPPTHLDGPEPEQFSWEVERFAMLALTGNPNLLEVLYSPLVEHITPLGAELRELAPAFLSRRVHRTYGAFARSQLARARADAEPRWKPVAHMLRLLAAGAALLETGTLTTDTGPDRDRLLAVRRGELTWPEITAWQEALGVRLDRALPDSPLPVDPDTARVESWLHSVRRRSLSGEGP